MSTESRELINYYLILDIRRNADLDAIETAYARMALKHHPDVAGDSPEVQKRFALINEAYSVLSNTEKKREYDQKLGTPSEIYQEEVITSERVQGRSHRIPPRPRDQRSENDRSPSGPPLTR